MITTIFDLYLETIATEVDRLQSDDFGAMCVDAGWEAPRLESILHERHKVFNEMNIVELDKELCDTDKNKIERHISKIARFYGKKMYLAKDILSTDNETVKRQYSQMDDCLKILKADSETTERIKSSYESLLLKYSIAVREFLQEMDDYEIRIVDDKNNSKDELEKVLTNEINQENETPHTKYNLKEGVKSLKLKPLYQLMIDTDSISKDIEEKDFIEHVMSADFSIEYKDGKHCNIIYIADRLRSKFEDGWQINVAKSLSLKDKNDITRHSVTDNFIHKCNTII